MSDRPADSIHPAPSGGTQLLLLDACCIINLYATGHIEDVLRQLPFRFAVSRLVVEREVLSVRRGGGPEEHRDRESISLTELESSGVLLVMDVNSHEEKAAFARFAIELDDGEASVCALAVLHGGGVATDDRKALRILAETGLEGPTLQTPELLFDWIRCGQIPTEQVKEMLRAIRDRASFVPRRSAPHFLWWSSFLR